MRSFFILSVWTAIASPSLSNDTIPPDSILHHQVRAMQSEMEEIQASLEEIGDAVKKNDKEKRLHFGLSLGYRWLTPRSRQFYQFASVSPVDSTLRLTPLDATSYLFSTSVIFDLRLGENRKPMEEHEVLSRKSASRRQRSFRGSDARSRNIRTGRTRMGRFLYTSVDRLCLVSNLNILDFSNGQKELAFNKSIEGGLGVGYRLNDAMFLGLNWEHVHSLQLYDDIKAFEGKKIMLNGAQVLSSNQLDNDNEDLYYRKSLSGWSVKMIIAL